MKNIKKIRGEIITALIIFIVESFFFYSILFSPNSHLLGNTYDDSVTSYYVVTYASRYDQSFHFNGMNYPFGDGFLYTGEQFPLPVIIHFFDHYIFNNVDHSVGIINTLILLSYLLCGIFLYKILREFAVSEYFAVILAVLITALSPQIQRFTVHYSLSYLHVFPLAWYLVLKIFRSAKPAQWFILFFVHLLFFSLIHLYFLAMFILFIIPFAFFYIVTEWRKNWAVLKRSLSVIICTFAVYLIIIVLLHFTDHINDRVKSPWGFFLYDSSIASVFYPPAWNIFNLKHVNNSAWEGFAYIGIACDILIVVTLFIFVLRLIKLRVSKAFNFSSPSFLSISFLASIIVLVISTAKPFAFHNQYLYNHLALVRQFRSIGRFAWIFYYVGSVYCGRLIYLLYRLLKKKHLKKIAVSFTLILLSIWAVDGYSNNKNISQQVALSNNDFNIFNNNDYMALLHQASLSPSDFQAILALPLVHIGSEKLSRDFPDVLSSACTLSCDLNLPTVDSYLNRTSLSQTSTILQIESSSLIRKTIVDHLTGSKPFLLFVSKHDTLSSAEQYLTRSVHYFYQNKDFLLGILPVSAFTDDITKTKKQFFSQRNSLFYKNGYYSNGIANGVIIQPVPDSNQPPFLSKSDSVYNGTLMIYEGKLKSDSSNQKFELSLWQKLYDYDIFMPSVFCDQYDSKGKLLSEKIYCATQHSTDFYNNWIRASILFTSFSTNDSIVVKVWEKSEVKATSLLIRPSNVDIYYNLNLKDSSFVLNNYLIKE